MSEIDVEVMRQRYDNWVLGVETLDHYITPDDVSAMLDEIVALRERVAELEAAINHQPYSGKYTIGQHIRLKRTGQTGVITERGYLTELNASGVTITYNNIKLDDGTETDADEYEIADAAPS